MFKGLIVDLAYYLHNSKSYQSKRKFYYNLLENDKYKYKKYLDFFMMSLIFISVAVLIREVKYDVNNWVLFFSNYIISFIFFIEYLLRLWIHSSVSDIIVKRADHDTFLGREVDLYKAFKTVLSVKASYVFSFTAIIDLLAILPFYHELRLLRIFILFRVFKLFRYAKSFQVLARVLATKKFEFFILAMFASIVIVVSSILIYVMEANHSDSSINTLFEALYWSIVTISTVGYGDVTPVTQEGQVVALIVITAGIAVLAFTTSLVVSAFTEQLDEIKEIKTIEDISKLKTFYIICGYEGVAKEVSKKLKHHGKNLIILDKDAKRIDNAKDDGLTALLYDPGSVASYEKLNIDIAKQVKYALCLYENDVDNVYSALTIRSIDKNLPILSLLMEDSNRKKLQYAGINKIVCPQELVGLITNEIVGKPVAFEIIHELRRENTKVNIEELAITKKIEQNIATIGELGNKEFRVILLGIYKKSHDRFYFNPLDDIVIEAGDYLLVIGYKIFIKEFESHLYTRLRDE